MTDEEIICGWMESRIPLPASYLHLIDSPGGWWVLGPINGGGMRWYPKPLTLDRLREVQARLTDEQWLRYQRLFAQQIGIASDTIEMPDKVYFRPFLHATAEQKIKALARVIGAGKEQGNG